MSTDELHAAVKALLGSTTAAARQRALDGHPALASVAGLDLLTRMIGDAFATNAKRMGQNLLALTLLALERYHRQAARQHPLDLPAHERVLALHAQLAHYATRQPDAVLARTLQQLQGLAWNTLGNHYADAAARAAASAYSQAIAADPDNALYHRNRASMALDLHDYALAQSDLDAADTLEPEAPRLAELWNDLGNGYLAGADAPAAASAAYTRAIAHAPRLAALYRNRADAHLHAGADTDAHADLATAADLEPHAPRLHALWCEWHLLHDDAPAAEAAAIALAALAPDAHTEAQAAFYRACALTLASDPDAATPYLAAARTHPDAVAVLARLAAHRPEHAALWATLAERLARE